MHEFTSFQAYEAHSFATKTVHAQISFRRIKLLTPLPSLSCMPNLEWLTTPEFVLILSFPY